MYLSIYLKFISLYYDTGVLQLNVSKSGMKATMHENNSVQRSNTGDPLSENSGENLSTFFVEVFSSFCYAEKTRSSEDKFFNELAKKENPGSRGSYDV